MPTIRIWRGDAQGRAKKYRIVPGNVEIGDQFTLTSNQKDKTATATVATVDHVCRLLVGFFGRNILGNPEEFAMLTATVELDDNNLAVACIVTGPSDGEPFTITGSTSEGGITLVIEEQTKGDPGRNEQQRITLAGATGGTFTLSFESQTSTNIAYNATAYTVRDALCALSTIAGTDEVQTLTISGATTGTFRITWNGQETAAIAYNANAAAVQTALENLSNIGVGDVVCAGGALNSSPVTITFRAALGRQNVALATITTNTTDASVATLTTTTAGVNSEVTVTGNAGGPWTVEFVEGKALSDEDLIVGNGANLTKSGYGVQVTTLVTGDPGNNEKQFVRLEGPPTGGTYTLTFEGVTTSALAYNANAAAVQAALEALSNIAVSDVAVSGTYTDGFIVEFTGNFRNLNVSQLTGTGSSLTGGANVSVATLTQGTTGQNYIARISLATTSEPTFVSMYAVGIGAGNPGWVAGSSAAQVNNALCGFGAGPFISSDFVVTVESTMSWRIEMVGRLAGREFEENPTGNDYFNSNAGHPNTIWELIQQGDPDGEDEVQVVNVNNHPTAGTFTLTYAGQTTAPIAYNASAAVVQTALIALSNIGASDVVVTGADGGPYTVTFEGTLASTDVAQMTGSGASLTGSGIQVTTTQAATNYIDEVQRVSLTGSPFGGTYTLTHNSETTGGIAYNADAATVLAALIALATPIAGDFVVSGSAGGPWAVTFQGQYKGSNQPTLSGDPSSLSGVEVLVGTIQEAVSVTNEVQTVTINGAVGGTFTLTFDGQETANIPYNASAGIVEVELQILSTIGSGNVSVSGAPGGPWFVEFSNDMGGQDVEMLEGDPASLTGSGAQTLTITQSQAPTGPNWFPEPENWFPMGTPSNGDVLVWQDSTVSTKWGLDDLPNITPIIRVLASFTGQIGLPTYGEYFEYRPTRLKTKATAYYIGEGEGGGSDLLRFDCNAANPTIIVQLTASTNGAESCIFTGMGVTTDAYVNRGVVGFNTEYYGDAGALRTLAVGYVDSVASDSTVTVGAGTTQLTTLNQQAGDVKLDLTSSVTVTTIKKTGGELRITGAAPITTLDVQEGGVNYASIGTVTNSRVGAGGIVELANDMRAKTFTNVTLASGSTWLDVFGVGVYTNGIVLQNCSLPEVTLDIGTNRTITVA